MAPPKFEVLYLKQLTDDQIRQVIIKKKGHEEGAVIAERVLNKENLAAMARKPVLVELLLASLDEVDDNILENSAQIYLYSTNKLLLRNIKTERTFTTTTDKLFFLCELAWEMIKNGELKIHYTEIPERINSYFKSKIKDQHELDTWDFDLRNQTLLHRNAAGYYEFAHKSLAEYFVAFKLASELGILSPLYMQTYCEADGNYCQMPVKSREILELRETFGYFSLEGRQTKALCDLLCEMISEETNKKLWEIIEFTRNKSFEEVKYLGGNAATLLLKNKETFEGANLENTVLFGADLRRSNLLTANVYGCDLRNTNLAGSKFDEKILNAKLGKNYVRIYSKGKKKLEGINNSEYPKMSFFTLQKEFLDIKIGLITSGTFSKDNMLLEIENCDVPKLIKSRKKIFKKCFIEFEIYFNGDKNITELADMDKDFRSHKNAEL